MPRGRITFDEFVITLAIPRDLPSEKTARLRRALNRSKFPKRLQKVIQDWLRRTPALTSISVTVSQ